MKKGSSIRNILKIIVLTIFVAFVGMQFIPATRNESRSMLETDFVKTFDVPFEVQKVLKTSCYDCHSNNTNYPWYNKIQPATWFLEGHITDGKKELNFSEFGSYSRRRQRNKLRSIVSQVKSDEMPLWSYTLVHWDADLSEEQKKLLEDWIRGIEKSL